MDLAKFWFSSSGCDRASSTSTVCMRHSTPSHFTLDCFRGFGTDEVTIGAEAALQSSLHCFLTSGNVLLRLLTIGALSTLSISTILSSGFCSGASTSISVCVAISAYAVATLVSITSASTLLVCVDIACCVGGFSWSITGFPFVERFGIGRA